jgi:hypothetical protein
MATNTTAKTFPGVYTSIVDKSFFTPTVSKFRPGLVGVASKGPFGVVTEVHSLKEFLTTFGRPITTEYDTDVTTGISTPRSGGYFLADAVDAVADATNSISVVRVGNQYETLANHDGISGADDYTLYCPHNALRIQALMNAHDNILFLRIHQTGKPSTVNVVPVSTTTNTVSLDPTGDGLAAGYTGAIISYSPYDKAANASEGVLYAYTYGTSASHLPDAMYTAVGSISGYKNRFEFFCASNATNIAVGDVYKIKQDSKQTTHELRVKNVIANYLNTSGTVYLEKSDNAQIGFQSLPLQDNYTAAALYKARGRTAFLYFKAATEGTWADGANSTQGLYLKVKPGSTAGTKKLEVYWNSALVETHDGITDNPTDTTNFWSYRLARDVSSYVYCEQSYNPYSENWTAANTVAPWDTQFYGSVVPATLPPAMPCGAINAGWLTLSTGQTVDTGGQFTKGYNGESPTNTDWIGDLNPVSDLATGIQAFEDTDATNANVIAVPMDNIDLSVMNQLALTCAKIKAVGLCDVPASYNGRQAVDWHIGKLPSQDGNLLDNRNVALYWNWFIRTNRFGETKLVPPSIGVLRAMGDSFSKGKPWDAVAGEVRGYLPEAQNAQFERVPEEVKQSFFAGINRLNPILKIKGRYFIYGQRTMQRIDSRLGDLNVMILINWILSGMSDVARRYVFDPNDNELLLTLELAFSEFLDRIANDRGIENYNLVMDSRNNTAETRNNREVIVDLEVIPIGPVERIYINAIVRESGAVLNTLT